MKKKLTLADMWLKEKENKDKIKKAVQVFLYEMYMQKNTVINTLQLRDYINEHIRLEAELYDDMLIYIQLLTPAEITYLVIRQAKEVIYRKKNRERDRERMRINRENMSEEEKDRLREYRRAYRKEYRKRRREENVNPDGMRITAT